MELKLIKQMIADKKEEVKIKKPTLKSLFKKK